LKQTLRILIQSEEFLKLFKTVVKWSHKCMSCLVSNCQIVEYYYVTWLWSLHLYWVDVINCQ